MRTSYHYKRSFPHPMTQPQPYAMSDIEAERARAGITCAALAQGVGITPRLYSEYKRGKCRIPLERANAMLAYIYARQR